jgi:uncharacterized membrane protein
MSKKGKKKNQDKIAAKKAAVLGTEKKSRLPLFVAVIGAVLIVAGAVFYVNQGGRVQSATAAAPSAAGSTFVSFPVSLFEDGKARHFEHKDGKFTIRYFILKSSDGVLRAAFDACDVCWPAGKGYYQEGDSRAAVIRRPSTEACKTANWSSRSKTSWKANSILTFPERFNYES